MIRRAVKDSFLKLNPKIQVQNPVMLLVFISAVLTSLLWVCSLFGIKDESSGLYAGDCDYPLVYRTVRELCGGYRGRTGKSSG